MFSRVPLTAMGDLKVPIGCGTEKRTLKTSAGRVGTPRSPRCKVARRFRGREIKTTGDGIFATFDGPARGVRCACAIAEEIHPLGIDVRAGLHTGECEVIGDDVGGIAVHIGARIASLAGPGEVLVSRTVKDLVAGSGLRFADRGSQILKGVPGDWQIYAVEH
jgi:class 3 adenylate cyclase